MPNLPRLRIKARAAIRNGILPSRCQDRTRGGGGTGGVCAVCGELLKANMTELEIEFDRAPGGLVSYRLHHRCFVAWELERGQGQGHRA